MKLRDLLKVADCEYHVFFKTEIADLFGENYQEIEKEKLGEYLNFKVLRIDQNWNITIG